jgi:hypothetical protein
VIEKEREREREEKIRKDRKLPCETSMGGKEKVESSSGIIASATRHPNAGNCAP